MFKTKYALALTGLLLSFASFNTASYAAFNCTPGDTLVSKTHVTSAGYSPETNKFYITTEYKPDYTFYNGLDDANKNGYIQPLEITAFLSHIPINFCYHTDSGGITWVEKLQLVQN
ncbi:hypothetical protein COMNV_00600 [Commensalibacter sp. Nvir]|uniref:hypothetical protein n=1 Tax=Commensalibacter sp. Nvir TaxID=3069817 RepID=UPI002D6EA276|nr:hypothetical protein COMNV_00600 [Commensalibacter sp. Nvir]